jgi:hypothetical protein
MRILPPTIVILLGLMTGCQTTQPVEGFQLSQAALAERQLQTRRFEHIGETELLRASAAVLQDIGFNLDESEADLGLIVASKKRSAMNKTNARLAKMLDIFVDIELAVDDEQLIRASLVTWPAMDALDESDQSEWMYVRVTFQRIVWNTKNRISRQEALDAPELYQQFFDRLSKSIFLEAHEI